MYWTKIGPETRMDNKNKLRAFLCRCICGTVRKVSIYVLDNGTSRSCGCINIGSTTHGHAKRQTGTYKTWVGLAHRCHNKKSSIYKHYGARGISVCKRWKDFENFYKDMGDRPAGMSLDRIDNNGNYEPSNCRWADIYTQRNNTRVNKYFIYNGKKLTIAEISRLVGISYDKLWARLTIQKMDVTRAILKNKYS